MSYDVPSYLKDELLFGDISDKIYNGIIHYEPIFRDEELFKNCSIDRLVTIFTGYVCYVYLLLNDETSQYIFLRTLNSSVPKIRLYPLIEEFIAICKLSELTDKDINNDLLSFKEEFKRINDYKKTPDYIELSKNDDKYRKYVSQNLDSCDIDISQDELLELTKCVIIESKNDQDLFFSNIDEAVMYALELYYKEKTTFEERKNAVLHQRDILQIIGYILDNNDFKR